MDGLAPIDSLALLAILAKAAGYAAALLAMGGPLFLVTFRDAPTEVKQRARKLALWAAIVGLIVLALRFGIRAARISGMGLDGAVDPIMLGFVWQSPLGTAALWQSAGEILVLALLLKGRTGLGIALFGAVLIAASFTFVGHTLGGPRWLLGSLLIIHLLAAAFWVGALAPLYRAVAVAKGAALLHRFGKMASATVAVLIVAGVIFAWQMTGSVSALFTTAHGRTLILKLMIVTGLMALAAGNKWRLVPALAQDVPAAAAKLQRAIWLEALAVALILIVTAALTSVTTPPVNL